MQMEEKELSEFTDQELLDKAKKVKSASIMNALVIGILFGVIVWSVAKSNWGFFTIILLYFIYKIVNNSKNKANNEALEKLLKERNLK